MTGADGSPSALERAECNAERARVQVDFQAFYHVFLGDPGAIRAGAAPRHQTVARLSVFEFA